MKRFGAAGAGVVAACLIGLLLVSPSLGYVREFECDGQTYQELVIPPSPPPPNYAPASKPEPMPNQAQGVSILSNVPAFDWCYGCSTTAAGIVVGYYDRISYDRMYTGPANGGVCPLDNGVWGYQECPIVASHQGIDGRSNRGHVDDYWVATYSCASDPYITGGWAQHSPRDCIADFMGTSQTAWNQCDGNTFFCLNGGSKVYDWTGWEPSKRDGTHGMRLYAESKGYTVIENYNQGITTGTSGGFTFQDYINEIDAGRPVLIQLTNHTMVGYGYDSSNRLVYVRNTWSHGSDTMIWGGSYGAGGTHTGVSVIHLAPIVCDTPTQSPGSGGYVGSVSVTVSCTTPGVDVHYTTNGADPTINDLTAAGPVTLTRTCVLKARAFKTNCVSSAISSADYTVYEDVSIAAAKMSIDNATIVCRNVVVSMSIPEAFFVENEDRVTGIRVNLPGHALVSGTRLDVAGTLRTSGGERFVDAAHVYVLGAGSIAPLYMSCRDLGGVDWCYDSSKGSGQRGMTDGRGPNNIGLLVRTSGSFSPMTSSRFRTTDASGCAVECVVPAGVSIDPRWNYISVTGVSGCESAGGDMIKRVLWIGSRDGIVLEAQR
jgi:hypothetical protein